MRPKGIANSKQLGLLKQALERYCSGRGIADHEDRDRIASSILRLFDQGLSTVEEISAALADISAKEDGRPPIASGLEGALPGRDKTNPSQAF